MYNITKCLSYELKKTDAYQFIDDVVYPYQSLIELIPWEKEVVSLRTEDGTIVEYHCEHGEVICNFVYIENTWDISLTISILDSGDKLFVEETKRRQENDFSRIVNKVSAIFYERSTPYDYASSSYHTLTEDNRSTELIDEAYIVFRNTDDPEKEHRLKKK